jgi:hypothetical protein
LSCLLCVFVRPLQPFAHYRQTLAAIKQNHACSVNLDNAYGRFADPGSALAIARC